MSKKKINKFPSGSCFLFGIVYAYSLQFITTISLDKNSLVLFNRNMCGVYVC